MAFVRGQNSEWRKIYTANSVNIKGISMGKYSISDIDNMDGLCFESFCAGLLLKTGFERTEITPGSGDQGIDVIGFKDDIQYGIQCKCYSSDVGNKAVQEAYSGKEFYNCHVAAVLTNRYFTVSAKELARKNRVLLWDRDYLINLMKKADVFIDTRKESDVNDNAISPPKSISEHVASGDNHLSNQNQLELRPKDYIVLLTGFCYKDVWKDNSYRLSLRKKISEITGKTDEETAKLMVDLPKQIATDLELEQARKLAYNLSEIRCVVEIQQPDEWKATEKNKIDRKLDKAHRDVEKQLIGFACGVIGLIIGVYSLFVTISAAIKGDPIPFGLTITITILSIVCALCVVVYFQSVHTVNSLLKEREALDKK